MKTFDQETKNKYIARAKLHREQDVKGCPIGFITNREFYAHEALEDQTGIPSWLSSLADALHEGQNIKDDKLWLERFIEAVPINTTHEDMEKIRAKFLITVLKYTLDTFDYKENLSVKNIIERCIIMWKRSDIVSDGFSELSWELWTEARTHTAPTIMSWGKYSQVWAAAQVAMEAAGRDSEEAVAHAMANETDEGVEIKYKDFSDELIKIMEE